METPAPVKRGSKVFLVVCGLIATAMALWSALAVAGGLRSRAWVSTQGQFIESNLGSDEPREYVYDVAGVTYLGWRSSFSGGYLKRSADRNRQLIAAARREGPVTVWYDPAAPASSTRRTGVTPAAFLPLIFTAALALAGWARSRQELPAEGNPVQLRDIPAVLNKLDLSRENLSRMVKRSREDSERTMRWYQPSGAIGVALRWLMIASAALAGGACLVTVFTSMFQRAGSSSFLPYILIGAVGLVATGFFIALATLVKYGQIVRGFARRPGKAIERRIVYVTGGEGGGNWQPQLRCAYEFEGAVLEEPVAVTFSGWLSQTAGNAYLDARIGPVGDCQLAVNPRRPAEAFLLPVRRPWFASAGMAVALAALGALGWFIDGSMRRQADTGKAQKLRTPLRTLREQPHRAPALKRRGAAPFR